jgi:hypothetical protein
LTYKSSSLVLAFGILSTFAIWSNNNAILAYGQQEQTAPSTTSSTTPTIKITSPTKGEEVPPGELTTTGISSDDANSNCTVYTDWNDLKPMQKVTPTGSGGEGGIDDYSSWTFTYSEDYHLITEGVNELTSKISCENSPSNITKSYSVNVTGVGIGQQGQQQQEQQQEQSPTSVEEQGEGETTAATESSELTANEDDNTPFTLPLPSENPDIDNDQSSESQEEEGGGVTTNKQDNSNVNPNDDDEPTIYWDLD